jgi:hypothetical protein
MRLALRRYILQALRSRGWPLRKAGSAGWRLKVLLWLAWRLHLLQTLLWSRRCSFRQAGGAWQLLQPLLRLALRR